jgi:hypothetical protein
MQKKWYMSKTIWVNGLALAGLVLQAQFGFIFTPETQAFVLSLVNVGLRTVTKEEITW